MNELAVIEREGQRVLTTQQLAEAYEVDDKRIRDNFTNNKGRYIEGKHFFKVEGEELKDIKHAAETMGAVGTRASSVYLWTERGSLLHAKSLNTEKAWQVYDMLVETYFTVKDTNVTQIQPTCVEDLIIMQAQSLKDIRFQIEEAKHQVAATSIRVEQLENKVEKKMTEDFSMQLVTPSQLGKMFEPAISAKELNKRLQSVGLQWKVGGEWIATVVGRKFSSSEPVQLENGKMVYQLKWQRRVKDLI